MIFGKIFHLSKEGSKAIVQAGIWLALFNLAALLPVILLAMASEKMITLYYADSEDLAASLCAGTCGNSGCNVCNL